MKEEVIFRMESAYREDFEVKSYHFGGPEKTMCIIGNMRGNEIQQLYIAGQMVRTLKRFEEEGRFIRRHGVTVIPCANPYSVNVGKRFWAMDNSDINRMYPGYNKGETTQRIAAGIFEKIQGYRFGVQFSSFYMPGDFVSHVRMMKTDYEDTGLAQLFGMPFVVLRKPVPFDTTTLNFNWQVWDTKAFSLYSRSTEKIDKKGADMAIAAVCRFLSRMNVLNYNVYGGYESTVLIEEELVSLRSTASGLYIPHVKSFDSVERGQVLADIIDPLTGVTVAQTGIFEKIQGYRFGVQFSSFYMPGDFVSHVRMMKTDYEDTGLAQLFGMPFVVLRKPVPFDTTTLNFNWQVWDTKAFSLYSRSTEKIDKKGADMAIAAVCRFLSRMNVLNYNVYGGYESTVLIEEELVSLRSTASGLYIPHVKSFDSVERGQVLADIIDPLTGVTVAQTEAPEDGIVFFAKDSPLVMENETLFKIVNKLHK